MQTIAPPTPSPPPTTPPPPPPKERAAAPAKETAATHSKLQGNDTSQSDRLQALDYYPHAEATRPSNELTLPDLIEGIKDDTFADRIAEIRRLIAQDDKKTADILKKKLPAVSISGRVTTGGRKSAAGEGRFIHSGFLQIDLDGKDNIGWTVEEMSDILRDDPRIVAGFVSASGEGVKGVARIPMDVENHKAAFLAAEAHFRTLNLTIDGQCKDTARLCFVSHDPSAWINLERTDIFQPAQTNVLGSVDKKAIAPPIIIHQKSDRDEITLDDLDAMLRCTPRLAYEQWLNFCNGAWQHFGEGATAVIEQHWREETPGEYAAKFAARFSQGTVKVGTCIYLAQNYGTYKPPIRARMVSLNIPRDHAERVAEAVAKGNFLAALENDHRGLAQAYADIRFSQKCFVHDEGIWRTYENGVWERDDTGTTLDDLQLSLTPLLIESVNEAVRKMDPQKDRVKIETLRKRARCLFNLRTARAVLENAQVLQEFRAMRGDFDKAPHLLAIENGVIDFASGGEFLDHSPKFMFTAMAPITFDPDAECPTFDQFLADVTCGDTELEEFHLETIAIALTGYTDHDFIWFHYGSGSNGKGTYTQTIEALMGARLFKTFDSALLVGNRESSSDDYKRASLEGIRLALADELPDGKKLVLRRQRMTE